MGKPTCRRCGHDHWNMQPCSARQNAGGTLDGVPVPPGFHVVRLNRPAAGLAPVPPGQKIWGARPFSEWGKE